ncbi:MAG TPA: hypothetical protein VNO70_23845 [Blastocatellia bacterium]|nr:hypothetical protein [Blastocatellia bacterium]
MFEPALNIFRDDLYFVGNRGRVGEGCSSPHLAFLFGRPPGEVEMEALLPVEFLLKSAQAGSHQKFVKNDCLSDRFFGKLYDGLR